MGTRSESLIIRADAGGVLGTGHVMRMLALAQEWQDKGGIVHFASVKCPTNLVQRVILEGMQWHELPQCALGGADDRDAFIQLANEISVDWIVLDGYHFDLNYQRVIRKSGFKLMVMDDYGHCEDWCADLIVNQNIHTEHLVYRNEVKESGALLGLRFLLLRRELREAVMNRFPDNKKGGTVGRLLVTLGGVDPDNVTLKILRALEQIETLYEEVRVIVGPDNPNLTELEDFAQTSHQKIVFKKNVSDMPAQYLWADAVISAAGSTCYEWLAFGLPGAVVRLAENQNGIGDALQKEKLALDLGWWSDIKTYAIASELTTFLESTDSRSNHSTAIDVYGPVRLVSYLKGQGFWIRKALPEDVQRLFDLANDPEVRSNSLTTRAIAWEEHRDWFGGKLGNQECMIFIAFDFDDKFIGQCRFDWHHDKMAWSIDFSIHRDFRGRGFGRRILHEGMDMLISTSTDIPRFHAEVKESNFASLKTFKRLGFDFIGLDPNKKVEVFEWEKM